LIGSFSFSVIGSRIDKLMIDALNVFYPKFEKEKQIDEAYSGTLK